jgi:hypothetical protein
MRTRTLDVVGRPARGVTRRVRGVVSLVTAVGVVLVPLLATNPTPAGASSPADQGVTSTTIKVGLPYVDFADLRSIGVNLNQGNFPDAYQAIAANMNAHGGVDGRKVVLDIVATNPAVPASSTSSCAQLTEDDHVFVAIAPVYPDCYQQDHDTPVIFGSLPGTLPASAAPDFTLTAPNAAFDPLQLAVFAKEGAFKGKKVGIFYGADTDAPEVAVVQSDLKKLHADVVLTAEDGVQATDVVAADQEAGTIAQRFESSGVNEVVAVGGAGQQLWPRALLDNQSTYKPPWIATDESALIATVQSAKGGNPYFDNVLAAASTTTNYQQWQDPAIRACAAVVHKAYPSDTIGAPVSPTSPQAASNSTNTPYVAVEEACRYLALFAKIADAAGKNLTVTGFTKAGYGLKDVTIPGSGGPISFGPDRPYAIGPVEVVKYDPTTEQLVPASATTK